MLDYLYFHQDHSSKHDKTFGNKRFGDLSGIEIPDVLMNLISCNNFSNGQYSTDILT